jgi:hypothetical protein
MKIQKYVFNGRQAVETTPSAGRCTEFFMGWLKGFGEPSLRFFSSPLNKKEHPNL